MVIYFDDSNLKKIANAYVVCTIGTVLSILCVVIEFS